MAETANEMMRFVRQTLTASAMLASLSACAATPEKPGSGAAPPETFIAGIGMRVRAGDVAVTPLSVIEDSRCPADVQCIQAGTVRLLIRLERRRATSDVPIGLEAPYDLGDGWLHFVAACPYPRHAVAHVQGDYRFTFLIGHEPTRPAYQGSCEPR